MNRALLLVLAAACGSPPSAIERRSSAAAAESAQATNPVVDWNQALLRIVRTPGAQPATVHPTRSFAILHAAMYDAVNSIVRTHEPYLISAAAAEVLEEFVEGGFDFSVTSEVMPGSQSSFDSFGGAAREATLSRIFAGQHFRFDLTAGRRLGRQVADFVVDRFLTRRDQ